MEKKLAEVTFETGVCSLQVYNVIQCLDNMEYPYAIDIIHNGVYLRRDRFKDISELSAQLMGFIGNNLTKLS